MKNKGVRIVLFVLSFASLAPLGRAQSAQTISLVVDATHAPEGLVRSRMVMPVKSGPLTLYFPKWIPGEHGPDGPISNLAGLKISASGKTISWERDLLDVFTFHINVPNGAATLDIAFDYIEPSGSGSFSGAPSATEKLVVISWNQNVLYPAGAPADQLTYQAKLVLPEKWKFGTPLPVEKQAGAEISFKPVSLERLVDSPVVAGEYYRAIDLTPPGEPIHHEIDLVADSAAALNMSAQTQKGLTSLVAESGKLFGVRHYREYHFLLTLSDHVAHFGLEHHECNDSRLPERVLLSPDASFHLGGLLAHEFVHSWNGKFRRPVDLSTPNYEVPMKTDLLWVYEGLTDYLGPLLAARSGLWTSEQYHEALANIAAELGPGRPGRTWRPLLDTAVAEPGVRSGIDWLNWRRGVDYYDEGDLIWLEVATILHREGHGPKSIDDFCHMFQGGKNSGPELKTYTLEELVHTLNGIAPYEWAGFFHERLNSTSAEAPVRGIENGGWKVVFNSDAPRMPGRRGQSAEHIEKYTLGLLLAEDGGVVDSTVGGLASNAGISPGMKVVGVNGRLYTHDLLKDAILGSKDGSQPISLLVIHDEYYKTCAIEYHGEPRYPHLVRAEGRDDYLDELIKPRAGGE
jgi:predicted metalloprotease with PDZ domain